MTASPQDQGPTIAALVRESFYRLFADEAIPLAGNIAFRTVFSVFCVFAIVLVFATGIGTVAARLRSDVLEGANTKYT